MPEAHPLQIRSLEAKSTLAVGRCCDLKAENGTRRYWLCRLEVGHTDHRVTVETWDERMSFWLVSQVFTDKEQ